MHPFRFLIEVALASGQAMPAVPGPAQQVGGVGEQAVVQAAPPTTVEDVVVRGVLRDISQRIDRRVYNVEADPLAEGSTALEVLGRIPSVSVSPGGRLSLLGQDNVTVLIDGRRPATPDAVRNLAGGSISRVEVMTNPPAQFSASGTGGVINVVTRSRFADGLSGSLLASIQSDADNRLSLVPNLKIGSWTLSAAASNDISRTDVRRTRSRRAPAAGGATLLREDTALDLTSLNRSASAKAARSFGAGYNVEYRLSFDQSKARQFNETSAALGSNGDRYQDFDRVAGETSSAAGGVTLRRTFKDGAGSLSSSFDTSSSRLEENVRSLRLPEADDVDLISSVYRYDSTESTWVTDYQDVIGSVEISAGLSGSHLSQSTSIEFQGDLIAEPPPTTTRSTSTLLSAYGSGQFQSGDWKWLPGLRIEHYSQRMAGGVINRRVRELDVFPSLFVENDLGNDLSMRASYSRRINRPDASQLDPRPIYTELDGANAGNPALKPEYTHSLELSLNKGGESSNWSLTGYYRKTVDAWTSTRVLNGSGVLIQSTQNRGARDNAGAELSFKRGLGGRWSVRGAVNAYASIRDIEDYERFTREASFAYNANMTLEYRRREPASRGDVFQAALRYSAPEPGYQDETEPFGQVDVSWRRPVFDRLVSTIAIKDLFNSSRIRTTMRGSDFHQITDSFGEGTQIRWTMSYRLGGAS